MGIFKKRTVADLGEKKKDMPEGLWIKCDNCREIIYRKELANTHNVCPKCGYHFRIGVEERVAGL